MGVQNQIETYNQLLGTFLASYFDGYNHTVSEVVVEFPSCDIRMALGQLPEDTANTFSKPLITVLPAPGSFGRGRWVTGSGTSVLPVFLTWDKHTTAVGYYVYRSLTEVGGYTKVSNLLTNLCFVDTPAAGTYWYQVVWVNAVAAENNWGSPQSKTASAIVTPKITHRDDVALHIFVSATKYQGGQRIVDNICSLLLALIHSSESFYLRSGGLHQPVLRGRVSLAPDQGLWTDSMFLTFRTTTEYS